MTSSGHEKRRSISRYIAVLPVFFLLHCPAKAAYISGFYTFGVDGVSGFIRDPDGGITTYDVPGSIHTFGNGINAGLQVSGYFDDASGSHGFIRDSSGGFVTYDVPGSDGTFPSGINDRGQVAGGYHDATGNHGFIRDAGGGFLTIDVPGSVATAPSGINNAGVVAGSFVALDPLLGASRHGFVRKADGEFLTIDLPGARATNLAGVNNLGDVSGTFVDAGGVNHGFILLNGAGSVVGASPIIINVPGSTSTNVNQISDSRQVAGRYTLLASGTNRHPFVWDYIDQFTLFDIPGSVEAVAHGTSGVPEPSSLFLLTTGLVVLIRYGRRWSRDTSPGPAVPRPH